MSAAVRVNFPFAAMHAFALAIKLRTDLSMVVCGNAFHGVLLDVTGVCGCGRSLSAAVSGNAGLGRPMGPFGSWLTGKRDQCYTPTFFEV